MNRFNSLETQYNMVKVCMQILINTNEIPRELSRKNMISYIMLFSHVKRSLLLWLHKKIVPVNAFHEMI